MPAVYRKRSEIRHTVIVKGNRGFQSRCDAIREGPATGSFNEGAGRVAGVMLDGDGLKLHPVTGSGSPTPEMKPGDHGPFSETKELIAGYWVWEVKSLEEGRNGPAGSPSITVASRSRSALPRTRRLRRGGIRTSSGNGRPDGSNDRRAEAGRLTKRGPGGFQNFCQPDLRPDGGHDWKNDMTSFWAALRLRRGRRLRTLCSRPCRPCRPARCRAGR